MSAEPMRPLITLGRVLFVFPELNIYAVQPRDGLAFGREIAYVYAIDVSSPTSTSRVGVSDGCSYAPGTEVLIMSCFPTNMDTENIENFSFGLHHYIIGPSYHLPLKSSKDYPGESLDNFIDKFNNQIRSSVSKSVVAFQLLQDMSYGRPQDTLAGEFVKSNMFGGQIRLTLARAVIGASQRSLIQMSALDDSLDIICSRYSHQSDAVHTTEYPTWNHYNSIERRARTTSEGLGASDKVFYEPDEDGELIFKPYADDQQGIFRQVKIDGVLVEGSYELVLTPEQIYENGAVRRVSNNGVPQFGFSTIHRTYDGDLHMHAAKNIGITRSAYVWAPRELDMEDNNPALNDIDVDSLAPEKDWLALVDEKGSISRKELADYASLMKDAKTEHKLKRYFKNIQGKSETDANLWKTYSKEDVESEYGDIIDVETKLKPIKDTEESYETDPSVTVKDPLRPEEDLKLQALLSCIELDESGAVLIHDGYGSEIKMHRGHITIAPAVDLKIRPGRSMISMVPKDAILRARQYVELSSDQNDILVKSQRDMKLLSGNGTKGGQLTLENRGTTKFKAGNREQDERPSGIVMKSYKGDMAIAAPNMYIGLLAPADNSRAGRTGADNGLLTLDAGKGSVAMSGRAMMGKFLSGVAYVVDSAVMSVNSSGVVLGGSTIGLACNSVKCGSASQPLIYKEVTEGGVIDRSLSLPGGNVIFQVDGTIESRFAQFKDGLKSDTVSANTCTAANGSFGNATLVTGLMGGRGPGNIGGDAPTVDTSGAIGVLASVGSSLQSQVLEESGFTGYGILYSGFFFKQTNKYDNKGLVESRYQRMIRKNGSAKYWNEGAKAGEYQVEMPEKVGQSGENLTEAWPGTEAGNTYKVKTISDDGLSSEDLGSLEESYVINTEK